MKIIFTLAAILISGTIAAQTFTFSGGSGTEFDPYLISNHADLNALNTMTNKGQTINRYYLLTKDLTEPYDGLIGTEASFNGHFDGGAHCITLNIDRTWDRYPAGLFGTVTHGSIRNLAVDGKVRIFKGAAIVGNPSGEAVFENLVNYADVIATDKSVLSGVGGVLGNIVALKKDKSGVTVKNCANFGTISCEGSTVGGVIGYSGQQQGNILHNLANYGHVDAMTQITPFGSRRVGGVVGNPLFEDKVHGLANFGTISNDSISGCIGNASPTDFGELFYDSQYSPTCFTIPSQARSTSRIIGYALKGELSDSAWLFEEEMFPRPKMYGMELSLRVKLYATPVILDEADRLDNITHPFKVVMRNGVTWQSENGRVRIANDGQTTLVSAGTETLVARLGKYSRRLPIKVNLPTGINDVRTSSESEYNTWFTLTGIKLSGAPSTKGVYIHRGRKILVK